MKRIILHALTIFVFVNSYSQSELVYIHNSVGYKIDKTEKNKYFLFPSIKDSLFKSTYYLRPNDSTYKACYTFTNDSIYEQQISRSEFLEVISFITRFDKYYAYQQQKDSLLKREMDSVLTKSIPSYQSIDNLNRLSESKTFKRANKTNYNNGEHKKSVKSRELMKKNGHHFGNFVPKR